MRVLSNAWIAAAAVIVLSVLPFCSPWVSAASDDKLLEIGNSTDNRSQPHPTTKIKVVSYNIRYRSGSDLDKLILILKEDPEVGGATILGLQEVDRNKKRSGFTNTAKKLADSLGMNYAWAAPPNPPAKSDKNDEKEEETGVAILSRFPLSDIQRIVLPNEGPGGRRRVAIGATVLFGNEKIRVYSVHAETRISPKEKLAQFESVLDDLATHPEVHRALVMGDFNTWQGDAVSGTTRLFTERNFDTPFENGDATWRTFLIKLKLDWIWHKGFCVDAYGIDRKVGLSDHWPLWMDLGANDCGKDAMKNPAQRRAKPGSAPAWSRILSLS